MAQDLCVAKILPTLVEKQLFTDSIPSIDIFDLDYFESRIEELQVAFHEDFCFHTLALKANPIRGVIQFAVKKGLGAETASVSETLHALSLNLKPHQVIFGSPCKTKVYITYK
jgi:diaminopimelate decarboxylase